MKTVALKMLKKLSKKEAMKQMIICADHRDKMQIWV